MTEYARDHTRPVRYWSERAHVAEDTLRFIAALVDGHQLIPSDVTAEQRLRQIRAEIHDSLSQPR